MIFFSMTRFALAWVAPVVVFGQSLTTYSFTISGELHTIVLPTPRRFDTTTVYVTQPAVTVTSKSVETRTFIVTGPPAQISNLSPDFPDSVGLVPSQAPGPVVPVVINGFTASINLPPSASIPSGPVTIPPVNIIAPTQAATRATNRAAPSAVREESSIASNAAGSQPPASEQPSRTPYNLAISGTVPVQVLPPSAEPTRATSQAEASSEGSLASSIRSQTAASENAQSSQSGSPVSSEASSANSEATSTTINTAATESSANTGTSTGPVPSSLVIETSSLPSSGSTATSEGPSPSNTPAQSGADGASSAAASPPQASSTAAPSSGVRTIGSLCQMSLAAIAGLATSFLIL